MTDLLSRDTQPTPITPTARQRPVRPVYRPLHARRRRRRHGVEVGLLLVCIAAALVSLALLAGWQAPARVIGIDTTPPEVVTTTTTTPATRGRGVAAATAPTRGAVPPAAPRVTVPPTGPAPASGDAAADPSASGSDGAPVGDEARPTVGVPAPAAAVPATTMPPSTVPAASTTTAPRTQVTFPHVPVTASTTTTEPPPEAP